MIGRRFKEVRRRRLLYYDGIKLVPAANSPIAWHIPGGETLTTIELIHRASVRDVPLVLHTYRGARCQAELLN